MLMMFLIAVRGAWWGCRSVSSHESVESSLQHALVDSVVLSKEHLHHQVDTPKLGIRLHSLLFHPSQQAFLDISPPTAPVLTASLGACRVRASVHMAAGEAGPWEVVPDHPVHPDVVENGLADGVFVAEVVGGHAGPR